MLRTALIFSVLAIGQAAFAPGALAQDKPAVPAILKDDAELAALSGGSAVTDNSINTTVMALTDQDLTAVNSGSVRADSVVTGAITLQGNALSDFNGVGNVVMNTGNNNNIQSSLSVTVIITPAPGIQ